MATPEGAVRGGLSEPGRTSARQTQTALVSLLLTFSCQFSKDITFLVFTASCLGGISTFFCIFRSLAFNVSF